MTLCKWWKQIALLMIIAVLLWWFGRTLNWAEVEHSLGQADWKLLAIATLIINLTYLLRAYRWQALLKPVAEVDLKPLFMATVVGFSAVFILGRAGEVVRPSLLPMRDKRVRPLASFLTIAFERFCDLAAIVLLFAVNVIWLQPPAGQEVVFVRVREVAFMFVIASLVGVAVLLVYRNHAIRVVKWFETKLSSSRLTPTFLSRVLARVLEQFATGLSVLTNPKSLIVTFMWTAFIWFTIVVANLLTIRAFGVRFGFSETVFVLGWALVGSLMPTPGGAAGAFHAATAAALVFLGVTREQGAAISIVAHLVDFAPALLFGFFYLLRGDITFARMRQLSTTKPAKISVEGCTMDEMKLTSGISKPVTES